MNGTTVNEKRGSGGDEHIKLLHFALNRLAATAPRLILSPATQPRRAAVAIVIHIVPPKNYIPPPPEQYETPQTLDALFAMDWVNQPGCLAEVLYIRRRAPVGATHNPTSAALSGQQHVSFPGGRMDVGDEGERYTGECSLHTSCHTSYPVIEAFALLTCFSILHSHAYDMGRVRHRSRRA